MATTAGALSLVSASSTQVVASSAVATAGTGPYTYQWYKSLTAGFSPGPGSIISGATSLTLTDSAIIPGSTYYYKVRATDSSAPAVTGDSAQLAVPVPVMNQTQNQFAQKVLIGMVDMTLEPATVAVLIDSTQVGSLIPGQAVKLVPSTSGGIPHVIGCAANSDEVMGFINFNVKNQLFIAGMAAEISMSGNVMWLSASAAITQGAQVCLNVASPASVQPTGASAKVVGWAFDGAAAVGQAIRVVLLTPSFATA